MSWREVAGKIAEVGAPLLGGLLTGGPVGAGLAALKLVAGAAGVDEGEAAADPGVVLAAIERDPAVALELRRIESEERVELARLDAQARSERLEAELVAIRETAAQARTELASDDAYVRRARPTWLYVGACSIGSLAIAAVLAVVASTLVLAWTVLRGCPTAEQLAKGARECVSIADAQALTTVLLSGAADLASALVPIIISAAAVGGYYVGQRSSDKALERTGERPPSLLGSLARRVGGR